MWKYATQCKKAGKKRNQIQNTPNKIVPVPFLCPHGPDCVTDINPFRNAYLPETFRLLAVFCFLAVRALAFGRLWKGIYFVPPFIAALFRPSDIDSQNSFDFSVALLFLASLSLKREKY